MLQRLAALAATFVLMMTGAAPGTALAASPPASATDASSVPHYFGPWPNWANSQLTVPDVAVEITGDGTGATADATIGANGSVVGLTITNPGSGYTSATVAFTGAGTGAAATATVTTSGAVTGVAVTNAGTGYVTPAVTITGGTTDATATAYGGIDAITLDSPGSDYTMPTVDIDAPDDPAGTQATAHVTCVETDCIAVAPATTVTIAAIVVDNPGSGYAAAPGVIIRDGTIFDPILGSTPAAASATISISAITLDTFGAGYGTPAVTISDTTGAGAGATATASTDTGTVTALTLDSGGSSYFHPGITKFQDALPGLCLPPACPTSGKYIPLGVADPQVTSGVEADQYVIGLVQYRTSFSSDLPDTLVRGYVQIETPANAAVSQHVPLTNELMDGTRVPVMIDGAQAYGVTSPQWLGPTIGATKDRPVRIVFHNLLPTGVDGNLFLPVDSSMMGSGMGPMDMPAPQNDGTVLDEARNPVCTLPGPKAMGCFTDNRATLHLHGGTTPWISDGTPHQWITPADEMTAYPQGVSVQNVPDMNVCNAVDDGCQTFYYTNEQSARLMFYHDHAWGITRLNVYAGEAAGYVITDATEQKLITSGTIPGAADTIPLVVQDRTFTPDDAQLALQDPTWDATRWGTRGSFWYHHVYMPAQNPGDPSGMSSYGRWMYGPWFWPPATPDNGPIANPYYDPACSLDDPTTWTYQEAPYCEPQQIPGTPNISVGMEQFNDTPVVNGTAYPTVTLEPKAYRLRLLNAANDRFWNLQWYIGEAGTASTRLNKAGQVIGATEVALDPALVAAAQTDINVFPTPVQGSATAGPDWIQIGTEGGFLPAPTVVDGQQPITWITDPTRFDVGNVDRHSLTLAPAERADTIVDFSKFAGKTLILYNDAPAAYPARVASYDYYTGAPDTGAGQIIPGYGPNTRTVMQVKIAAATPATAFNLTKLQNAFKHHADGSGVFESGQHPIIVGQAAYNSAYGTSFVASGNCSDPNGTNKCDGMARINQQGGQLFRFDNLKGSKPQLRIPLQPKALHDEMNSAAFDEYGRMTANLGLEAVPATPAGQNIMLFPYVAPPTEVIDGTNLPQGDVNVQAISKADDGTQIWKLTHNGVDTHPIHFHLYDVQILNRVTWDNIIIPTEPSELGWKDTIRVSPLEDTIVALRPIVPKVPFEVPNSIRPLNPMMPLGANIDPKGLIVDPNGNVSTITNALTNYGWEYVYHCHILSHEEMDMMRPVLLALPPLKADTLAFDKPTRTLSWNDNSITETSFIVQKSADGTTWTNVGAPVVSPLDQPNIHQVRTLADPAYDPAAGIYYRVVAVNAVGAQNSAATGYASATVKSFSAPLLVGIDTTTTLTSDVNPSLVGQTVTFTATVATAGAGIPTGSVQLSIDGIDTGTPVALDASGVATFATATLAAGSHTVLATYAGAMPFGGSSGSLAQTVNQAGTATSLVSSANPSTFGDNVTFTAVVSQLAGTVTPTGSVSFAIDGGTPVSVPLDVAGMATLSTTALAVGSHTVTADYPGTAAFVASSATPLAQVVNPIASTTVILSDVNPSAFGDTVTFTATVTPPAATGSIEFFDGTTSLGQATLGSGSASLSTAALTVGDHTITAVYSGDANHAGGTSNAITQSVIQLATTTGLVSSRNPSMLGDTVTFTATVSPSTATGTITFTIDGMPTAVAVAGGQASLTTSALAIGNHDVVAAYSGDGRFLASTSPTITQVVGPFLRATTTVVTSNRVPTANLGQTITFTATVRPATGTGIPTGTVQFAIDGVNVGTPVTLNAQSRATYATATLASGSHNVVATYAGSAIFAGSGSATYVQVVNTATTTTVVTSNRNPSVFGQSVTFTARVTPSNGPVPTGTVQFFVDGVPSGGLVTLSATGRAQLVVSSLAVGTHAVSAAYQGNGSDLPSTSADFTQTVNRASSRTVVTTNRTPTTQANPATLTARVTAVAPGAGVPGGLVQFQVDGVTFGDAVALDASGVATITTAGMSVGRHIVTAVYAGDGNFLGSTSGGITQRIQ